MSAQLGVDVGTAAIKVVELTGSQDRPKIEGIGLGVNPLGNLATNNEAELRQLAEAVRKTVMDAGIKKVTKVRSALPEWQVYTRVIEVPPLSEAELASALSWEAEQYIPVPLAEVNLDWEVLRRPTASAPNQKMEVLLVAAPKAAVEQRAQLLQVAGLEPIGLETEILATVRSLVRGNDGAPLMIGNLGAMGTTISIVEEGRLVFAYAVPTGGIALTRAVSQGLGLEFAQAEEYKRSYGLDESQLEGKIGRAMATVGVELVTELRKAMNFYAGRSPKLGLKRLILAGGGAQMPGLTGYLAGQLNLEVIVGNPLAGCDWAGEIKQRFEGVESVFAVAMGLALGKEG